MLSSVNVCKSGMQYIHFAVQRIEHVLDQGFVCKYIACCSEYR